MSQTIAFLQVEGLWQPWDNKSTGAVSSGVCSVCVFVSILIIDVVQMLSLSDSLHPMDCNMPGFPVIYHLPECAQIHVHWVSDAIQTISSSVAPFSSCLQSFPASGSFPMSALHISWPKYWSFSFSISSSNEYSGLISFRTDWFDFLAVQGTLKSLLQHRSAKAPILIILEILQIFSLPYLWWWSWSWMLLLQISEGSDDG